MGKLRKATPERLGALSEGIKSAMAEQPDKGIVLALGSGGARGLAHVGVIEMLAENDIPVRAIVGSSIGAEIGAFLAAGVPVGDIHRLAAGMDWKATLRLFMPEFGQPGIFSDRGIRNFLAPYMEDKPIEKLPIPYAAVATDLVDGAQVLISEGPLLEAVCASIAIPGLLPPVKLGKRLLADGGLVNQVPFDIARSHFGGPVVAVAVHPGVFDMRLDPPEDNTWSSRLNELLQLEWTRKIPQLHVWLSQLKDALHNGSQPLPSPFSTYNRAMDISRAEITRLREERAPPDLMIRPEVSGIGMFEFYRAKEALNAGREAARKTMGEIRSLLKV
jgi:NTE family protein